MDPSPGAVVGGRYVLERELARGGMGSVWVAMHNKLDERVAIKFMDTDLAASAEPRERFEREAKAAAKLRSPHVVQVFDYGVDDNTPFIVMELLEGEDLRRRLKRVKRMSLDEAAVILTQACKALRIASDAGIVHRDMKPGNIFLAESGDDETVKLLDFGVAKATLSKKMSDNTSSGILLGSPSYMSPEQARQGKKLDHRSDLFSMAVILFNMVTGKKPFRGEEIGDVIVKICTEPAPSVRQFVPELPEVLDRFFDRALAKDPDARFQSAGALAAEFSAIAQAHTGIAAPPFSSSGSHPAVRVSSSPPEDSHSGMIAIDSGSLPIPGTLTAATRSVAIRRSPTRWPFVLAGVVVAAMIGGLFMMRAANAPLPEAAQPAAPAAAEQPTEPSAMPEPAATPEPSAPEQTEPSATAELEASAAPSEQAATKPPVTKRQPRTQPRRPPKPSKDSHPVLGF